MMLLGVMFGNHHVGAPCSLTDSQIHGLIKTVRFFENPVVVCYVKRLKIVIMACGSFNLFSLVFEEKSPYRVGCHVRMSFI